MILNFIMIIIVFEIYINGGEYVMSQVVYDLNDQVIIQNTEYKVYVRSL